MKKFLLFVFAGVSCVMCCAFAASKNGAAIYIDADFPLSFEKRGATCSLSSASWKKSDRENGISATKGTSDKYETMSFTFTPSRDGDVKIILRNRFMRGVDGKVPRDSSLFDDVKVGDALLSNGAFENGLAEWEKRGFPRAERSHGGMRFARVTYSDCLWRKIGVKAGIPVKISAVVCDGGAMGDGDYPLDLSGVANIGYTDGAPDSDGEFFPLKNFFCGKKRADFGGVCFSFVDPASNGGNSMLTLSSKRRVSDREVVLNLSDNRSNYKFAYLLHASGKSLRKSNKMKNVGSMLAEYADGTFQMFWVKRPNEAMNMFGRLVGDNAMPVYEEDSAKHRGVLYLSRYALKNKPVVKITLMGLGYAAWNIAGITMSSKDVPTTEFKTFPDDEWRPVDISDLEVESGSALDVSRHIADAPAGKFGRLKISSAGEFVFEGAPERRVKFRGTNWRPGDQFFTKIKTKADIDTLAKVARKQGYNMIRWRLSMRKGAEFIEPYKLRAEVWDMYDYFMFAMAREGIYTHLNLSSHDLGDPSFKWDDRNDVKLKMLLGDKSTRESWRKLVEMQLEHVNKYSGRKWKDDPAIATTEYFNEMEIGFQSFRGMSRETAQWANSLFQKWLEKKYGSDMEKLKAAWRADGVKPDKLNFEKFSQIKAFGNYVYRYNRDLSLFHVENGRNFLAYCENYVRNVKKFSAPLHQYNCGRRLDIDLLSAEGGSYTALNVYFAHPSEFNSLDSATPQESSLVENEPLSYFRAAAAKHMPDRPMALTEWQHCHWNPYKHEAGVVFPALSALQDFDNLTVHDYAVEKRGAGIFGHAEVARSPIMRANEFMSHFLFFRGDVKKSPHRIDVVLNRNYTENNSGMAYSLNTTQTELALLAGFAVDFPDARKISDLAGVRVSAPDMKLAPAGMSSTVVRQNFVESGNVLGKDFDLKKCVAEMRAKNILPKDNITDIDKGIFQSDTGEITLRLKENFAKVVTAKSEATAVKPATKNETLGVLTVKSTSVPAAVALISVDDRPLCASSRMVLVYSTDTIATGFKTSSSGRLLKSRGRPPVRVRVGKLSASARLPRSGKYSLYALSLTGKRVEKISAPISGGVMSIEIDTAKLAKEPAVFYEIVAE